MEHVDSTTYVIFDPNRDDNPTTEELKLMRPENGEVISPKQAQHERAVTQATLQRTVVVREWGPKEQPYASPDELTYSA